MRVSLLRQRFELVERFHISQLLQESHCLLVAHPVGTANPFHTIDLDNGSHRRRSQENLYGEGSNEFDDEKKCDKKSEEANTHHNWHVPHGVQLGKPRCVLMNVTLIRNEMLFRPVPSMTKDGDTKQKPRHGPGKV